MKKSIINRLNNLRGKRSINVLNKEDVAQFLEDFENLSVNEEEKQINKINFGRFVNRKDQINFHLRPSFPGKDIERRQRYAINTEFNGESIYVWNIDGTSKYQIYDILNNMLTCSRAYESNVYTNGSELATLLINEYSESLKMWLDHGLTNEQREAIRKHWTRIKRTIKAEDGTLTTQEIEEE